MKRIRESDSAIAGINVVPIIDVCLVLLVMLFVLSPVISIEKLTVNLPEAMTKEAKDQNVTVSLAMNGDISVDSDIVSMSELPKALKAAIRSRENIAVVIRADKELPYASVENLIKTVNRFAGKNAVAIATKQRSTPLEGVQTEVQQ